VLHFFVDASFEKTLGLHYWFAEHKK
jgi:hypothetical protein